MNFFSIKDLENLSGIKAHTIRIWEQRYGFLKPKRTSSNIRYYDGEELKKLLNVALLNRAGFRVSEIDAMTAEERKKKVMLLTTPYACHERTVTGLLTALTEMDTAAFEKRLDACISEKGFAKAVSAILFPFLEKIGLLWATSHLLAAQEHYVTGLIRRKFLVAIDAAHSRIRRDTTFLLLLPEGEFHELGLLYVWYLLKSRGFRTVYLGANTPVAEAAALQELVKVDYVYLHLTSISGSFCWESLLGDLHRHFRPIPVVISGLLTNQAASGPLPDNITIRASLGDVVSFLNAC